MPRYLEPNSNSYCGSPENEIDVVDPISGEEYTVCDCISCRRARRAQAENNRDYETKP